MGYTVYVVFDSGGICYHGREILGAEVPSGNRVIIFGGWKGTIK